MRAKTPFGNVASIPLSVPRTKCDSLPTWKPYIIIRRFHPINLAVRPKRHKPPTRFPPQSARYTPGPRLHFTKQPGQPILISGSPSSVRRNASRAINWSPAIRVRIFITAPARRRTPGVLLSSDYRRTTILKFQPAEQLVLLRNQFIGSVTERFSVPLYSTLKFQLSAFQRFASLHLQADQNELHL
jgi:hypothetical protein